MSWWNVDGPVERERWPAGTQDHASGAEKSRVVRVRDFTGDWMAGFLCIGARPTQAEKGNKGPAKYRGWFQDHEEADGGLCYRCPPSP
ncbi:uncharacterized protein RSE6_01469 [Rhynchosporium secalis]|uniref:Uncharacterized protein n=1 Tax=Rhynchosporium secalis TaxID=38038 RepID=A0A1E1LXV1_RHYSE|nr:uncharacterized protein RSE6_01469 [Rhynchosporium secalis]